MKSRLVFLISALILNCAFAFPQRGHHDPAPQDRSANPDRQIVMQQPDSAQVRREAEELSQLASTIPPDVAQAMNGILAKDLKDRLKKIEKLSKRLRSDLLLD